ncbi:hypothetical protein [Streptomyces sp. KR80]|uniref:hypothetical protein n=1 Tax=Streptomyces sp. KR80 TaxID=3457426 RepID=UPI003FCF8261
MAMIASCAAVALGAVALGVEGLADASRPGGAVAGLQTGDTHDLKRLFPRPAAPEGSESGSSLFDDGTPGVTSEAVELPVALAAKSTALTQKPDAPQHTPAAKAMKPAKSAQAAKATPNSNGRSKPAPAAKAAASKKPAPAAKSASKPKSPPSKKTPSATPSKRPQPTAPSSPAATQTPPRQSGSTQPTAPSRAVPVKPVNTVQNVVGSTVSSTSPGGLLAK